MNIVGATDRGAVRKRNEDNFWGGVFSTQRGDVLVAVVCDGLGGLSHGDTASRETCEIIRKRVTEDLRPASVTEAIYEANKAIYSVFRDNDVMMGTTCTVLYLDNGRYRVFHTGDSRCYHISSQGVQALTYDETGYNKFINEGKPIPEGKEERYKSLLTNGVGLKEDVHVNQYEGYYRPEDRFLLCSDGFWHRLNEKDFEELHTREVEKSFLESKINDIIFRGESDNITAVWVESSGDL